MPRQSFVTKVWVDVERELDMDMDETEIYEFHEETLREEARQTALMNKLQAYTHTTLLAVQLQKEMGETLSMSLHAAATDTSRQIEHNIASQGTHNAIDLLRMINHTPREATMMASNFGKFLKAVWPNALYAEYAYQSSWRSTFCM